MTAAPTLASVAADLALFPVPDQVLWRRYRTSRRSAESWCGGTPWRVKRHDSQRGSDCFKPPGSARTRTSGPSQQDFERPTDARYERALSTQITIFSSTVGTVRRVPLRSPVGGTVS